MCSNDIISNSVHGIEPFYNQKKHGQKSEQDNRREIWHRISLNVNVNVNLYSA